MEIKSHRRWARESERRGMHVWQDVSTVGPIVPTLLLHSC